MPFFSFSSFQGFLKLFLGVFSLWCLVDFIYLCLVPLYLFIFISFQTLAIIAWWKHFTQKHTAILLGLWICITLTTNKKNTTSKTNHSNKSNHHTPPTKKPHTKPLFFGIHSQKVWTLYLHWRMQKQVLHFLFKHMEFEPAQLKRCLTGGLLIDWCKWGQDLLHHSRLCFV